MSNLRKNKAGKDRERNIRRTGERLLFQERLPQKRCPLAKDPNKAED